MIRVNLIQSPLEGTILPLIEHVAKVCYNAEIPEFKEGDEKTASFVEQKLFKTGHHTTLQHANFTFEIEGIAIGDVTFGLHLPSPYYNSDQRSGRFCSKMFLEPDFEKIWEYISFFWPESHKHTELIMTYIDKGISLYQKHITQATSVAKKILQEERPIFSESACEQMAPKIAQEQMRMFIPIIFPTALDFTVNLSALVAFWESAWTPPMKFVTEEMRKRVIEKFPELAFFFQKERRTGKEWFCELNSEPEESFIKNTPTCVLTDVIETSVFSLPNTEIMQPVDRLHFTPHCMDNNIAEIRTMIEISVATMGQDQRHRAIRRGIPIFTGNFYVPPILQELVWSRKIKNEEHKTLFLTWEHIYKTEGIPKTLGMVLAPYGAMVSYSKVGSLNAVSHEQMKRTCFSAQEEIYNLSRLLRSEVKKVVGEGSDMMKIFNPPCFSTGKCAEGNRFCGRDISWRKHSPSAYFPLRRV